MGLGTLVKDKNVIGCKLVYKVKHNADGSISRYKAILVAKDYAQTYEIDYEETFSPVPMLKYILILLPIAAHFDYKIWLMDIKTAFLNGYLDKTIYMVQTEGFIS